MLLELSTNDLVNLICGIIPSWSNYRYELKDKGYGDFSGPRGEEWEWNRYHLELMNENALYRIYLDVKKNIAEEKLNNAIEKIAKKYGNQEVVIDYKPITIITITDGYGTFTKVRLNNSKLEIYHDWFERPGWWSFEKAMEEYPSATCEVINQI